MTAALRMHFFRVFTIRSFLFLGALVVLNVLLLIHFTQLNDTYVNRVVNGASYARQYFKEGFWLMKITFLLWLMFLTNQLFSDKALDIPLLMRVSAWKVLMSKVLFMIVSVFSLYFFLQGVMLLIFSLTPFADAYLINRTVMFYFLLFISYYAVIMIFLIRTFAHSYALMVLFFTFFVSEILLPYEITDKGLTGGTHLLNLIFLNIGLYADGRFLMTGHVGVHLVITAIFLWLCLLRDEKAPF